VLTLILFCWPFGALAVVLIQGRRGYEAVTPFTIAGAGAFLLTGILLIAALVTPPEIAVNYLFYGTSTFGGAILSALSALALLRFARRAERPRNHPGPDDDAER
jgi:hypothetical protein